MMTAATAAPDGALGIDYVRPWMYPAQVRAIFDAPDMDGRPSRYSLIEASTKSGKTVGCMAWLVEQAIFHGGPGKNFWWVAPILDVARIAFRRIQRGLPLWAYKVNRTNLTIELWNGSTITFKGADHPDSLYGEDVHACVIDEASRMKEEAWHAVRSTLTATKGPIRIIGNVKGQKNWFFKLARRAEAGARNMHYSKITAYDAVQAGVLDADEIADAKEQLPEAVFNELYLAMPSDDGGNPFGLGHIRQCLTRDYSTERLFCAGVDLARSVDWSVVLGLDKRMHVCGMERFQSSWADTERKVLQLVGNMPTLVDATGVGSPIVEAMTAKRPLIEGYKFTQASKQRLMEGLALAIQKHMLRFPAGALSAELENFEYTYTRTGVLYSAPEGYHDDTVVAAGLAVEQFRRLMPDAFAVKLNDGGLTRISPNINFGVPSSGGLDAAG